MKEVAEKVGNRIRRLREARGFSQEEFARVSGVHRSLLAAIERGKVDPTFATLYYIVVALRVPMSTLLRGIEAISARG